MIYFIALICFLLPSYLIRFSIFGIPTTLLEVLIYLAAIVTLISKLKTKNLKSQLKTKKYYIPIALFIIAGLISIVISPDKKEALGLFKAYIFDPILFFIIVVYNVRDWQDIKLIIKALIFSGFLIAIQALWQKLTGQVTIDGRVIGIFDYSPNYLALYLAPILVLTFGYEMLLVNNNFTFKNYLAKKIWIYDLAFFTILLALWFSGSRAAMIAVIIGVISYFVIKYWTLIKTKIIYTLLLYCFITLLLIGGWQSLKPNWQATPDSGRISSSNNIRWEIWSTTVEDIIPKENHWLWGVGLGNYQNYFTQLTKNRVNYPEWIAPMALTPHNLFLTIWINLGLLGLISFVWVLILFFRSISHKPYAISYMLFAAMITIIAQGLVDSPYWKNDLAMMFWILLAISLVTELNIQGEINER